MRPFLAILLVGILGNSCIRAAEYELIIKSAKIKSTKADDKAWDLLDDPDPYAVVGMIGKGGKVVDPKETKTISDTLKPVWNEKILMVDVGDSVSVKIWDKDVSSDDLIGEATIEISKEAIKAVTNKIKFGQVEEFIFVIRKPKE